MTETHEEIVGKLYALRAGLSLISEEADKLSAAEDKTTETYLAVTERALGDERERGILLSRAPASYGAGEERVTVTDVGTFVSGSFISKSIKENPEFYGVQGTPELLAIVEKAKSDDEYTPEVSYATWLKTEESKQYYEKMKTDSASMKKFGKGFGVVALILAPIALVVAVFLGMQLMILGALIGVVAAIALFAFGIISIRGKAESKEVATIGNLLSYLPTAQREMADADKHLAETAQSAKDVTFRVYSALENEFSALLDPRDWQYLDLVIFYFETGRAENMKEALQLVEREVQTQRIVSAVEMASERICGTITRAAVVISSQLRTLSAQLTHVVEQQQIQNALLAKANATSEQLVSDVSYIKYYGT